jgi:hypothetical protein
MVISWTITIAIVLTLVWIGYNAVKKFRAAEGTTWERLLAGFKDSATILVAGATYVAGALIDVIGNAATALNQPEIAEIVKTQIPVQWAGYGMMALAAIVFIARLRSLK